MLGTDVIGCCLLDSLPLKLASSVHGVAAQCLVRTSLVAAYWIRFPKVFFVFSWNFGAMPGTDVIGCCLWDLLPFKLSSSVH